MLGCFNELNDYDCVEIIINNPNVSEAQVGDIGEIVMTYPNSHYEIENVLADGRTKWLGTFSREQLKWTQTP